MRLDGSIRHLTSSGGSGSGTTRRSGVMGQYQASGHLHVGHWQRNRRSTLEKQARICSWRFHRGLTRLLYIKPTQRPTPPASRLRFFLAKFFGSNVSLVNFHLKENVFPCCLFPPRRKKLPFQKTIFLFAPRKKSPFTRKHCHFASAGSRQALANNAKFEYRGRLREN
ncbi:hypothetical protein AVEN_190665-1 [Araneus ventricosus]|uniref:Uncharacterized protein n=1 Tax=Araneus ventricosus TaxID=182803 RepID=A0A4Y2T9H1_ARAVE|nr:hypothetical protein AVEN_190665-1 [Araneus ventricosus]